MARRPQPPFLRLDEIEADGDAASDEIARETFDGILRNGGQIDWSVLGRGGPTVARSLLRLSVEAAKSNLKPQAEPPARGRPVPGPVKPKVAKPRVDKNWRGLREEPEDNLWFSFLRGAVAATITSVVATIIIKLLHR